MHYRRKRKGQDMDAPARQRNRSPENPGEWGRWFVHTNGYVKRERYVGMRDGKPRYESQMQHRYVMEQAVGRPLLRHENPHHRNGDKTDNRIENLELWSTSQPPGQRVEDKLAWAREIIDLYGTLEAIGFLET